MGWIKVGLYGILSPPKDRFVQFEIYYSIYFQPLGFRVVGLKAQPTFISLLSKTGNKIHPHSARSSLEPQKWFSSFPYLTKKEVRTEVQPLFLFGQGWIRTTVLSREQIYSLSPLATRPPTHILFSVNLPLTRFELVASPLPRECATPAPQRLDATRANKKSR